MCKPLYFDTFNYVINPWMKPGTINKEKAMQQWLELVKAYAKLGITVEVMDQQKGDPDMVFSADQGIVFNNKVLLSRFWCTERKNETTHYKKWFTEKGYTIINLPDQVFFEGNGDAYLWNDQLLIGTGFRADEKTCNTVSKLLNINVIPLEIIDPLFYHLDVGFFPLNQQTAFYYPTAFSQKSRGVLKKIVPNLIEFSKEEAFGFCANSIVTDNQVIQQKGNPTFVNKLHKLGYESIEIETGEFMKSGGGIHCLTNILEFENV
jgi:N-dimethylarginine dimethylaminohydrolase